MGSCWSVNHSWKDESPRNALHRNDVLTVVDGEEFSFWTHDKKSRKSSGTSGYGLIGMVVLGWQLDLMILEVFSNLWFYDSVKGQCDIAKAKEFL